MASAGTGGRLQFTHLRARNCYSPAREGDAPPGKSQPGNATAGGRAADQKPGFASQLLLSAVVTAGAAPRIPAREGSARQGIQSASDRPCPSSALTSGDSQPAPGPGAGRGRGVSPELRNAPCCPTSPGSAPRRSRRRRQARSAAPQLAPPRCSRLRTSSSPEQNLPCSGGVQSQAAVPP